MAGERGSIYLNHVLIENVYNLLAEVDNIAQDSSKHCWPANDMWLHSISKNKQIFTAKFAELQFSKFSRDISQVMPSIIGFFFTPL